MTSRLMANDTGNLTRPSQDSMVVPSMAVLAELFILLEEYAPAWYTEELRNRALAALRAEV